MTFQKVYFPEVLYNVSSHRSNVNESLDLKRLIMVRINQIIHNCE